MRYGELPKPLGIFEVECNEMMFYQYLPIKKEIVKKSYILDIIEKLRFQYKGLLTMNEDSFIWDYNNILIDHNNFCKIIKV